jgi:hypothetical protein
MWGVRPTTACIAAQSRTCLMADGVVGHQTGKPLSGIRMETALATTGL